VSDLPRGGFAPAAPTPSASIGRRHALAVGDAPAVGVARTSSASSTHFLRASTDPAPMFPVANRRSFGYARTFARCPGYAPS
jgi:hypothetical protein